MTTQQTNNLTNIGVGVDINLTTMSAVYLLLIIALGSAAFFACKKYIR